MNEEKMLQELKVLEELKEIAFTKTKEILSSECSKNASSQTALIKMIFSADFQNNFMKNEQELINLRQQIDNTSSADVVSIRKPLHQTEEDTLEARLLAARK